jgi:glycosyltransferase involved in cell wall biosynthesis
MPAAFPRFCVVTPSYNTGRFIRPCIDSVLAQTGPEIDYIVMDGGSTDGTVDVLRSYGDRLKWVSAKDKGQSDAINRGFAQLGKNEPDEVLAWLNSDDTYSPGAFAHVAEIFAKNPEIDCVYGGATYIDSRDKHIAHCVHIEPYSKSRLLYYSDFIVQPTTFFRRRAFDAVGQIRASTHWIMDYELWIRFAQAGFKFAYTPRVLAHFRWLSDNKTATGGMKRLQEVDRILASLNLPTPAYLELERCNLLAKDVVVDLVKMRFGEASAKIGEIVRTLRRSPRAFASLFDPFTWHVIWVGQVLRARSEAVDRRVRLGR